MQKLFTVSLMILTTAMLAMAPLDQAEAKRFGFGKSFGKSYNTTGFKKPTQSGSSTTQQKQSAQQTTQQPTAGKTAANTGSRRWLGPLAGLAAGGLLAAMFMGDAFEGIQIFDILMIVLLAFGLMAFVRSLRARQAPLSTTAGPLAGAAGEPMAFRQAVTHDPADARFDEEPAGADFHYAAPDWFNADAFVSGSKTHYLRLQAAWDKNDMKDIAEYTTPQFYAELQSERLNRGEETHFTDVVRLDAELVAVQHDGDQVVASIRFSGLIREEEGAEAQPFSEIWHITHDWADSDGDWFVAGIQQEG